MQSKEGLIIVNKPSGISSFRVISVLRQITGIRKIGHAGTLDPLASGILVCAIGRGATKFLGNFLKQDKSYIAEIKLGATSSTYDADGDIKERDGYAIPKKIEVLETIEQFIGDVYQTPPIFSAKKINGVRAYHLARLGREVKMEKQKIRIDKIKIIRYKFPNLEIEVDCGSGTYIRSLANDIGEKINTGGYIVSLKRIRSGNFKLSQAVELDGLSEKNWYKYLLPVE